MNAIECENLTRVYGRVPVVDRVSLTVPPGSIFALLGPNGSGKSTTLKMLLNLVTPTSGRARILGCESTRLSKRDFRRIGYVNEEQVYPEWMSVRRFIDYYRGLYPNWDRALEDRLRAMFELPDDRPLRKLSRGMRVKAILLSVLSFHPELLVLDEPFGGLDPQVRDDFINGMLEVVGSDRPNTVIVSSHDIAEVERLADWVGILLDGRLVVSESMTALQARFRRMEIVGAGRPLSVPDRLPDGWMRLEQPASTVVQVVHRAFADPAAAEAEVRQVFGSVTLTPFPMSLREIFLAHSNQGRTEKQRISA